MLERRGQPRRSWHRPAARGAGRSVAPLLDGCLALADLVQLDADPGAEDELDAGLDHPAEALARSSGRACAGAAMVRWRSVKLHRA